MRRLGPALLAAVAAAIALPATASAATVVAEGVLRASDGRPASGTVTVFGWPHHQGELDLPVLGHATAGRDGRYRVVADNDAQLAELVAARGESLDLLIQHVTSEGTGQDVVTARFPRGARAAAATGRPGAQLDLRTRWKSPPNQARAAQGICFSPHLVKQSEDVRPTVIGELNNAYRDTRASWAYGSKADSSIQVAFRPDGGNWEGGGSKTVDNELSAQVDINGRKGPYSRQFTSNFKYVKYWSISRCPGMPSGTLVRAEEWIGGFDDRRKQRGALRVCPKERRQQTVPYVAGAGFRRDENRAVVWNGGVSVFGVGLDVRSGFSRWVRVAYRFGGREGKLHYLCGSSGRSPNSGARIYSGVKPS